VNPDTSDADGASLVVTWPIANVSPVFRAN
jgi:hypothetical protein